MEDHNVLSEKQKINNCVVCDGSNFTSVDGFYYCDECGAQAKDNQELEHEDNYNLDQKLKHTSTIQIQSNVVIGKFILPPLYLHKAKITFILQPN